ncbi:hypothetical protein MRX96_012430 [Rhipicephalus microplus]
MSEASPPARARGGQLVVADVIACFQRCQQADARHPPARRAYALAATSAQERWTSCVRVLLPRTPPNTPPPPMAACPEEDVGAEARQQHRSRLLGAATADRRKSTPCQPKFMQCRRGRPSLDLTAAQASGHITLGSHLESEIARRRHSVAAAGADKPAATSSDRGPRAAGGDDQEPRRRPGRRSGTGLVAPRG